MHPVLLDAAGGRRPPVTLPGYHSGRSPRNKGRRYPADPPTVEEIIAVMRAAGASADGVRLGALIVVRGERRAEPRRGTPNRCHTRRSPPRASGHPTDWTPEFVLPRDP